MVVPTPAPARDRLLDAAARLFYARGTTATGIDTIVAEAGVAKMSLYNNFGSKDDLVLAYLQARHAEWLELYAARVARAATPTDRVLAVFDAYLDHANAGYEHGFRGCGLLNAAAELPVGAPGRDAVRRHKEEVEALLAEHLRAQLAGTGEGARRGADPTADARVAAEAQALAEHLAFLLEGATSRAGLEGGPARIVRARDLARDLLAAR
ncbi:TetR family transcriptional regulator [Isoptericola jiangsuensis]|uniref:TetR family transcriptional regulator n=1 Tax=Isoptericola jiangsuensis TaxID=548579 RepID=A0A2A9ETZ6_9MICO|nr:TetR/AcrR family transcriptional regulator [Isoptericola jiangsuensis]PFG41760.1 TetR family transcriptional regulator [Isoptericola jiangsuensis]